MQLQFIPKIGVTVSPNVINHRPNFSLAQMNWMNPTKHSSREQETLVLARMPKIKLISKLTERK